MERGFRSVPDSGKAFSPDFTFMYLNNLLCASVANAICRDWYKQGKADFA